MKIVTMKDGKEVEIPIEQVWPSIVEIINRARLLGSFHPEEEQFVQVRRAFLVERLRDIEDMVFRKD